MSDSPVLIVGAGPTGLVLAIELARRGVPFHLVDRMARPAPWSAAIFIKSRTLEILTALGLIDAFMARGEIVEGVDLYVGNKQVGGYRFHDLDTPHPFILSIPEEDTIRLLTDKLEQLSGRVERGVEFLGLEEADDSVRARLKSDVAGEDVLEVSWVVGTDGYHSAVRAVVGDRFDGKDYPELWGVVDSRIENWRHPRNLVGAQLQPPNVIPFPLGTDRWRVYFRPETADAAALEMVDERLALVSPGARLVDPGRPQFFKSHSRLARKYRIGRVLLAGDAAHGSNPIEGHGMNAGMQDAFNLGWKLALVVAGQASDRLLDSYEAERRPVDRAIVQSGDVAYRRMQPAAEKARQEVIRFLATAEGQGFAALAEAEIGFGYERSPIVGGQMPTATGGTQVGFRVGDAAPLVRRHRACCLHECIAVPGHSLFVMIGEADPAALDRGLALARAAAERHAPHVQAWVVTKNALPAYGAADELLHDPTGALHERFGADRPSLCLVRPDGHLGLRAEPPSLDALQAHLAGILRSG